MATGKFTDWINKDGLTLIEGWVRMGLTDSQVATNIGITRNTFYTWLRRYPELKSAVKRGKAPVDIEVENAMLKSALGYEVEETKTYIEETSSGQKKRVEKTKKYIPPNVTAQIFWLKNRQPELWRDRHNLEHDGEVTQNVNHYSKLNDDELRKLANIGSDE